MRRRVPLLLWPREMEQLGKPTPNYSSFQLCAASPAVSRNFVFREHLTGCGHCLPLSSNRPPLRFKRGQGSGIFQFFSLLFADLIIPTNRRSKAGQKKACPLSPYLRSYHTRDHTTTTTRRRKFLCDLSLFFHNTTPIPPSKPRAPGCPRPKSFNTFQHSPSSCFTSSIELPPFPCHHRVTSFITPRCLPRRAPPPRR